MKRLLALSLALLMIMTCLAGCGSKDGDKSDDNGQSEVSDTLRIAMPSDAKALDPTLAIDNWSQNIYGQIYEPLLTLDEEKHIVPNLASYEQLDEKTYEFTLKQGVKFHNGEELKASDVIFTLNRGIESPMLAFIFGSIDPSTIEATSEYSVKFSLKEPSAPFLAGLTAKEASIMSEKAVTEGGDEYAMNPVGTGPYKFVKWSKGVSVELTAFEDYHGDKPAIKNLMFRPIPEATNRTIELETGNVDISIQITPSDVSRVESNADLGILKGTGNTVNYLGFNTSAAPLDNVKVRQAVSHAIDVEGITNVITQGYAKVAKQAFSPNMMFYDESIDHISYDVELAKKLLAEAGYPDGFTLHITTDERKERVDIATIVQSQLAEIGIDVKVDVLEWGAYLNEVYSGKDQMYVIGWSAATPDPDVVLYSVFHSSMMGEGGNMSFVNDPEIDELLEKGRTTFDYDERVAIYSELQAYLKEYCPWVYLWVPENVVGFRANVTGLEMDPMEVYDYAKVSFK